MLSRPASRLTRPSSITSKCFITASGCTALWAINRRADTNAPTTELMNSLKPKRQQVDCPRPAKQKRALLKSNPPRDNWIEGDEIKPVSIFGEANTSPKNKSEHSYFRAESCLKNLGLGGGRSGSLKPKKLLKTSLSNGPFFRSKPNPPLSV